MYGKIVENELIMAPSIVEVGNKLVFNPSEELLIELGFREVAFTNPNESVNGKYIESYWEEEDNQIVQKWRVV